MQAVTYSIEQTASCEAEPAEEEDWVVVNEVHMLRAWSTKNLMAVAGGKC